MSKRSEIRGRQQRLLRCNDGPEELATTTEASVEEDEPEILTTTTEASIEKVEDTMPPSERLRRWRRWCVYGLRVLTTTTVASEE